MAAFKDRTGPADDKEAADAMLATAMAAVVVSSGNGVADDGAGAGPDDEDRSQTQCGIGPCHFKWMQVFANKQVFLATFCFSWVLQGMFSTYFVSVITTLEKLFQLQSKTMGLVLSATEIGQIGSSLLLTYYGGQGHRPRWIASSMVLFGVATLACSSPHFLFGHHQYPLQTTAGGGGGSGVGINADGSTNATLAATMDNYYTSNVCVTPEYGDGNGTSSIAKSTSSSSLEACEENVLSEQQAQSKNTQIVLVIFFVSLLGVGIGQTAVYTLGIPFIDDNVASRESPLYFSITIGVRILGPSFGFLLGSFCTRLYADLSTEPNMDTNNPRWVGAWWLGLVGISVTLLLASMPMFAFPKQLPRPKATPSAPSSSAVGADNEIKKQPLQNSNGDAAPTPALPYNGGAGAKAPKLRDFPTAVKRLLKNDILMYRTASSVFHLLPLAGIYTFLPKYFESQFHFPTHTANLVTGIYGIMVMGIGIIISGVYILKKNPNARAVAAWIAFTALAYSIGMCVLMFFGCPTTNISGLRYDELNEPKFESRCVDLCVCDQETFSPICGVDGITYYSACHAGCRNQTLSYDNTYKFTDCQCMNNNATEAFPGSCKDDCEDSGFWYIALFSLFVFIHSTSEVGSMLLILRCVHPQDKAMALGLIQFAIGLFGNVPCPILYGAVVDSACLIWEMTCGKQGACSLYNSDSFRIFYHGVTGLLMMCAFFVDIVVWYKAGSISFEEDRQLPSNEEELSQLTPITDKTETTV
ncbi:Organic anion transporter polypeptide OATP,Kazal domain,Major facilitator superfamily domain [Cinara cedri]|uniref:Solute carrier organic anion transporter family member n=1 Tax=Cinara cedri TaxID=506608 RepID=A0A5E4NNR2_9HEMI|nr:Organic anion transporter polypeptide OATP,Kazal domain,Major facilitator superfamily domain [Cinara cedri]